MNYRPVTIDELDRDWRRKQQSAKAAAARREKKAREKERAATFTPREIPGWGSETVFESAPIPLQFGLSAAVPKTAAAAWGARMIFQHRYGCPDVGFVMGRNDVNGEPAAVKELQAWLGDVSAKIIASATLALVDGIIRPDKAGRFVIYEDDRGRVVGNTNASYGYLYVAGWLKPQ